MKIKVNDAGNVIVKKEYVQPLVERIIERRYTIEGNDKELMTKNISEWILRDEETRFKINRRCSCIKKNTRVHGNVL
jgi:hypothetical protein